MPHKPKKPCTYPGCPALVENGSRCETHRKREQRHYNSSRNRKEERFYKRAAWVKLRKMKLSSSPLCERCEAIKPATVVHHKTEVKHGGEKLPPLDELESLCAACHNKEHGFGGG